jgi:hypothetical protein
MPGTERRLRSSHLTIVACKLNTIVCSAQNIFCVRTAIASEIEVSAASLYHLLAHGQVRICPYASTLDFCAFAVAQSISFSTSARQAYQMPQDTRSQGSSACNCVPADRSELAGSLQSIPHDTGIAWLYTIPRRSLLRRWRGSM